MLIIPPPFRQTILEALIAEDGPLDAVLVGLFQSSYTPSINSTYAELDAAKATFSGYAASAAVTWTGPYLDASKTAYVLGELIPFDATVVDPFVSNSIGGYYLYTATTLKGVEQFTDPITGNPAPVSMTFPGALCPVIPRFAFGQ